jgi:hypothetical protein
MTIDPIHQDTQGGWYFWDETWADRIGPFQSRDIAERALKDYSDFLTTGSIPEDSPLRKKYNQVKEDHMQHMTTLKKVSERED